MARKKPTPTDPKTLPQTYHRWLYQDYAAWWQTLTPAAKQVWEVNARRSKITGFNYWMRDKLANLPDVCGGWRLDERSGNLAIDFSKNQNHATIYGATPVPGVIDYALDFDGIDDYLNVPNPTDYVKAEGTIAFFLHPRTRIGKGEILYIYQVNYEDYFLIRHTYNDLIIQIEEGNSYKLNRTTTGAIVTMNQTNHYAITQDGTGVKLWKNAVEMPATGTNSAYWTSHLAPLAFWWGKSIWAKSDGILDNLLFLDRALTQAELQLHSERRYPA